MHFGEMPLGLFGEVPFGDSPTGIGESPNGFMGDSPLGVGDSPNG